MNREPQAAPPKLAQLLLTVSLPDDGVRESVMGDLHEIFLDRVDAQSGRRIGAQLHYWRQACHLSARYSVRRLLGSRPAGRGIEGASRVASGPRWSVEDLGRGLAVSIRSMLRSPGFTLPALLILAIGMSSATAIFTVVDAIVFRPLTYPDSDRLVMVCEDHPRLAGACVAAPEVVEDLREEGELFSALGIGRTWPFTIQDEADGSTGVRGGIGTPGFFRALGVEPLLGRLFETTEHGPDNDKVVILSHGFWASRFASDPAVVGSVVRVDSEAHRVVGVLPYDFEAPLNMADVQIWKPPHFDPRNPENRGWRGFRAVGALRAGVTLPGARTALAARYQGLRDRSEAVTEEWRLRVPTLQRIVVGDTRPVLLAFLGSAAVLLLIVCANVANLLLARGVGRQRELAVRAALGADRGHLVGGILAEGLLLTSAAMLVSLVLSGAALPALLAAAPPMPRMEEVSQSGRVLIFAGLVSAGATLAFALLPAMRVTSWDLARTIKSGERGAENAGARRLRRAMVVAQLSLSVLLLATAGLLLRSYSRHAAWNPGFDRGPLLAMSAFTNGAQYESRPQLFSMWREAEERAAQVPGIVAVATASAGPLFGGGDGATPFVPEGRTDTDDNPSVWWFDVGPGFFSTLGVPVVEGREFRETDGVDVENVAVVNEAFARSAWPAQSALGRTVHLPDFEMSFAVVGVVGDVPPLVPGEVTRPEIYFSGRQWGRPFTYFLVRSGGDPNAVAEGLRQALLSVDPDLSLGTPRTLTAQEQSALVRPRFQALVLGTLALAALTLSAVGVYAVVSYTAARRIREMGIRITLGAQKSDVMGLFLGSTMRLAAMGVSIGLLAAIALRRFLSGLVHGVSPADPVTFVSSAVVLLGAAALAAYVPARRVTRADPRQVTRPE